MFKFTEFGDPHFRFAINSSIAVIGQDGKVTIGKPCSACAPGYPKKCECGGMIHGQLDPDSDVDNPLIVPHCDQCAYGFRLLDVDRTAKAGEGTSPLRCCGEHTLIESIEEFAETGVLPEEMADMA